jgi:hypothetical protein
MIPRNWYVGDVRTSQGRKCVPNTAQISSNTNVVIVVRSPYFSVSEQLTSVIRVTMISKE